MVTKKEVTKEEKQKDLLRRLFINENDLSLMPNYTFTTPKDIRESAMDDALEAYKSCLTKLKQGQIHKFKLRFRKKKAFKECMSIPHTAVTITDGCLNLYSRYKLGKIEIGEKKFRKERLKKEKELYILNQELRKARKNKYPKIEAKIYELENKIKQGKRGTVTSLKNELKTTKSKLKEIKKNKVNEIREKIATVKKNVTETKIEAEVKILYSKPNGWHLILPYYVALPKKSSHPLICALDPGLRTFITGCDVKGRTFSIGDNCFEKIKKRFQLIDKIRSQRNSYKDKNRRKWQKTNDSLHLQYLKQSYAIDDLHLKTVKFLTNNFDIIILPHFDCRRMIMENNRFFNRKLLALAHYKFRMRLQAKCDVLNKKLVIVNESYTSMTCADCGCLNYHLGSSKTFTCPHCGLTLDRDINASINILHKSISKKL